MNTDQQIWSHVPYCVRTGLCGGIHPNACHCHVPSQGGIWALVLQPVNDLQRQASLTLSGVGGVCIRQVTGTPYARPQFYDSIFELG